MEKIKLVFLGTSCSTPTKARNLAATALRFDGNTFLFDCAEGTQRQMMKAKVSYMNIQHIFLSHLHADHFLGIPGLLATMSMHLRDDPLFIYGPRGTNEKVMKAISLSLMKINFDVKCIEVKEGTVLEGSKFRISAVKLKHDVPCFGYVFETKGKKGKFLRQKAIDLGVPVGPLFSKLQAGESVEIKGKKITQEMVMDYSQGKKGKKISIIMDTRPAQHYFEAISGSDVLVHESAFLEKMKERALESKHTTAKEAGEVAAKTECKKLVLTHISPRHKEADKLENEARTVFPDVVVAEDLMEMEI